jgi:hypothetical protein
VEQIHPALVKEIQKYVRKGFRVVEQTPYSAQLVKPKRFSFWWALFWFCMLVVGLVVYLFYYAAKKDEVVYLQMVGERVQVTKG